MAKVNDIEESGSHRGRDSNSKIFSLKNNRLVKRHCYSTFRSTF